MASSVLSVLGVRHDREKLVSGVKLLGTYPDFNLTGQRAQGLGGKCLHPTPPSRQCAWHGIAMARSTTGSWLGPQDYILQPSATSWYCFFFPRQAIFTTVSIPLLLVVSHLHAHDLPRLEETTFYSPTQTFLHVFARCCNFEAC
jgi:hypothetical protein